MKVTVKSGDLVRIETQDETYDGLIIPRPDIIKGDFVVLKLDNGYNIGIEQKKIKSVKVLEKRASRQQRKKKAPKNPKLPAVTILSIGGTISSKVDYTTGGVYAQYDADDFVEMLPELASIANIQAKPVMQVMSEDMTPTHWKRLAKEVEKELNTGVAGVVITQGTDTLHYTSAALSLMLGKLSKPVVLTASQRSIDRGSSDAFMNLICAVKAAAEFDGAEVMTCMHATSSDDFCYLIRGTKVRKMHTSRRDAFRPINDSPIAKIFPDKIETIQTDYVKRSNVKIVAKPTFSDGVALINVYPGMDPGIIDYHIKKGYRGMIIGATALGHVATEGSKSLLPSLKKAVDKGVTVVIATQTVYGRVHPYVYTNLRKLSIMAGCTFVEDMLAETAYVKLGWVLSQTKNASKAKELMLTNIAGEMTTRSSYESYLM